MTFGPRNRPLFTKCLQLKMLLYLISFLRFALKNKSPFRSISRRKDLEHRMKRASGNKKHRMTIRQNCFRSYSSYGARVDLSALSGPAPPTRYKDLIQFSSLLYRSEIHLSIGQNRGASNPLHFSHFSEKSCLIPCQTGVLPHKQFAVSLCL